MYCIWWFNFVHFSLYPPFIVIFVASILINNVDGDIRNMIGKNVLNLMQSDFF